MGDDSDQMLPPGWETAEDPSTGEIYYFNENTGEESNTIPMIPWTLTKGWNSESGEIPKGFPSSPWTIHFPGMDVLYISMIDEGIPPAMQWYTLNLEDRTLTFEESVSVEIIGPGRVKIHTDLDRVKTLPMGCNYGKQAPACPELTISCSLETPLQPADTAPCTAALGKADESPPPALAGEKRFLDPEQTPGPGHYNLPEIPRDPCNAVFGKAHEERFGPCVNVFG